MKESIEIPHRLSGLMPEFMKDLAARVKNIIVRPGHEWRIIKDEHTTYRGLVFRYISILAAVPPVAAVAGRVIFDRHITNSALASSASYLILSNVLWYCMYIVNVVIVGAIISVILLISRSGWDGLRGLKIAAYSFTPLFAAGFIAVFPRMSWIMDAAILYSVYLLYLGIINLGSFGKRRAVWYAAASFLSAAAVVGVMNLFEYFFESIMISKIVF